MLVCFALKEEAALFRKMAAGKSGISILIVGVGGRTPKNPFATSAPRWSFTGSGRKGGRE
jgi:hypothetical protein